MSSRALLTYADFAALPDDGRRYELIDGELFVTPSPALDHQVVLGHLHVWLYHHVEDRQLGRVLLAPFDVILSNISVVEPDLVFVERASLDRLAQRGVEGAATLAVEILSPSTAARDRGRKKGLYARHGVPFYWLVDPRKRTLEAFVLRAGAYALAVRGAANDTVSPPPFPALRLPLARIWAPPLPPRRARSARARRPRRG